MAILIDSDGVHTGIYPANAWTFETAQLRVELILTEAVDYEAGDSELVDDGERVVFDSVVRVVHKASGTVLGEDSLSGSDYDEPARFWKDHRDSRPMHRNCEAYRAARGANAVICHYFPSMVREACEQARQRLAELGEVKVRLSLEDRVNARMRALAGALAKKAL